MSKISAKSRYESSIEWYNWAKKQYPTLRQAKKPTPKPLWSEKYNG